MNVPPSRPLPACLAGEEDWRLAGNDLQPSCDPCQLVWQVKEIISASSFQSDSPAGQAGRGVGSPRTAVIAAQSRSPASQAGRGLWWRYALVCRNAPFHSKARGGFTILELLLASLFGAILVAALWSLLSTYERLFTTGEERTERTQLVRSVLDQLAEDLTSAIADNAASPSVGPAPVRRFGLFGSSQFFQVDVLQAPPVEITTRSDGEEGPRRGRARGPRVPELHTVQWRFSDPEKAATGSRTGLQAGPSWSGLARRELDWETPASDRSTDSGSRGIGRLRRKFRLSRPEASPGTQVNDRFNIAPDDPAVLHVPEVTEVAFRYFDGQGFSDEWNSLSRKSLPMAVEIVLRVRTDDAPRKDAGSRAENEASRPADRPADVAGETHRLLVYLPTTSLARRSEAEKPSLAAPAPTIVYRPRPLPAPPPPSGTRPSVQTIQPDQWMRTGQ